MPVSGVVRLSQCSRRTSAKAMFSPVPQRPLRPQVEESDCTPGIFFTRSWNSSITAIVWSSVCPSGRRQYTEM